MYRLTEMLKIAYYVLFMLVLAACSGSSGDSGISGTGKAGSLARFMIHGDVLYTLNGPELKSFSLATADTPAYLSSVFLDWDVETLFSHGNHLLVGSRAGVYIFDVSGDTPVYQSVLLHAKACDPVVAQGTTAFVTLRGGVQDRCRIKAQNQLDVIDLSDIQNPRLIKTYPMTQPGGLAVDGNRLFICDGPDGLKQLDISDLENVQVSAEETGTFCHDVIAFSNRLYAVSPYRLEQFDYSGPPLVLLSSIDLAAPE